MQTSFKEIQPQLTPNRLFKTPSGAILLKLSNHSNKCICIHPSQSGGFVVGELLSINELHGDVPVHGQVIIED